MNKYFQQVDDKIDEAERVIQEEMSLLEDDISRKEENRNWEESE